MEAEAALHRNLRSPHATAGLLVIVFGFAMAPFFTAQRHELGYGPELSLPLGALGAAWTLAANLAYRRHGLSSRRYLLLNRGETFIFLVTCLAAIAAARNPVSPIWLLHVAHVVTSGASGGDRRFNTGLFTVLPALTAVYFGVVVDLEAAALVAGISIVSLFVYGVLAGTAARLTQMQLDRDRLEAELRAVTVSKERARIARDLHDGVGTELSSLFWQLQSLQAAATTPEAKASFEALTSRITQSTDELRNVVWELRATSLAWPELIAHLRSRCVELSAGRAKVSLVANDAEAREVPEDVRMHLARIVQEAVRNAIHHGRASSIEVRLALGDGLELEIDDDGQGIAPDAARRSVGGLRNIDVRVSSLGGRFSAEPGPGGGTRLRASVPLPEGPAATPQVA